MNQTELQFPTDSPINASKLGGQNKRIFEHLMSGRTINCIEAQSMFVLALHSRISELRNKFGITINDKFVSVGEVKVKQYWI